MEKDLTEKIKSILLDNFSPKNIEVYNDSYKHAGHREAGESINSHFKIVIDRNFVEGTRIEKHRAINESLKAYMNKPIHAIEIKFI